MQAFRTGWYAMLSRMLRNVAANGAARPFATVSVKVSARRLLPAFRVTNEEGVLVRIVPLPLRLLLGFVALALLVSSCDNGEEGPGLRIGAWNLEHLDDTGADGCVPRDQADYDDIAAQVEEFGLDVVAFQEVETEQNLNPSQINLLSAATAKVPASLSVSRPKKPLGVRTLVRFRHDIVTVEHAARLVSHDGHDHLFRNALKGHVSCGAAPQAVEHAMSEASSTTSI